MWNCADNGSAVLRAFRRYQHS